MTCENQSDMYIVVICVSFCFYLFALSIKHFSYMFELDCCIKNFICF